MAGCRIPALLVGALAATGGAGAAVNNRPAQPRAVVDVIRYVFGPSYADEALRVAWCESRYSVWATNGQYVNIFQMGTNERRRYGWHEAGDPAWKAARAAYRLFVASGYSWERWTCKP